MNVARTEERTHKRADGRMNEWMNEFLEKRGKKVREKYLQLNCD